MADAFETGDAAYIAKALGVVARAKEMRAARATPGEIGIGTDTAVGSAQAMTHLQPSLHQMQNVVPAVERWDAAPNKG
jgi:DNA-binding phage protein